MAIPFETSAKEYVQDYLEFRKAGGWDDSDELWNAFRVKHNNIMNSSGNFFNRMFADKIDKNAELNFHDAYIVSNVKPEKNDQFSIELRMMKYIKDEAGKYTETDGNHVKFYFDDKHRDAFRSIGNKTSSIMAVVYKDETLGVVSELKGKMRGFVVEGLRFSDFEVKEVVSNKRKLKF